jgi:hypothetical protein
MASTEPIGYYVHHHGDGHATRYRAIAAASERRLVPITERTDVDDAVHLPSDVPTDGCVDARAGGALHWAPLHAPTATPRLRVLVEWLDRARPAGVVVDVSVEVALACRLAGVPTIYVRLHGNRTDPAHHMAFASATGLLAPYPSMLESEVDPTVIRKTHHTGFIHPIGVGSGAASPVRPGARACRPSSADAVVLWGGGGGLVRGAMIDALARAIDGNVYCAGRTIWAPDDRPSAQNVIELGWIADTARLLEQRPVVVSSGGNNCVTAAARMQCPLVVVALPRPFDEQVAHAAGLARAGVAVRAPTTDDTAAWHVAVATARQAARSWDRLQPSVDGAPAAAAAIDRWFAR